MVEKSHQDLVAIDKSVQGMEKIKIESDNQQTLHLDVNQNLHQNSGKKEPRKRKSDSNERKSDFNERKSDSNERNLDSKDSIKLKAAKRKQNELNDTGD